MKKILLPSVVLLATTLLLAACSDNNDKGNSNNKSDTAENASALYSKKDDDVEKDNLTDEEEITSNSIDPEPDDSDNIPFEEESENTEVQSEGEGSGALSEYSHEEIEYARVWLQLGDTQDIDELNAKHISAGEPLNPDDKTSIDYPEDVIQLTTSRLAEGSITYSSMGDGTIKLYKKIPQRWDGKNPAGEDTYKKIIDDTEQESIDPGDNEKVKALIGILTID